VKLLTDIGKTPPSPITTWANVKWSKILINSVPVGINKNRGPWTPEENHYSLATHNPSYTSLLITQQPNWVRPPSTLTLGTQSSLVMAFEDPDGTARCTLLASKYLYIHGNRARVSCWKETPHPNTNTNPLTPTNARPLSPVIEPWSAAPSEKNAESADVTPPKTLPVTRNAPLPANPLPVTRSKSCGSGPL